MELGTPNFSCDIETITTVGVPLIVTTLKIARYVCVGKIE